MALSAMSPVAKTYMTHTPPSVHNSRPSKRNTVHWEKHNLDQNIKENTLPDFRTHSSQSQQSGSLSAANQSPDALVDFNLDDWKLRGQHRRPQIAAETFVAPNSLKQPGDVESDLNTFDSHSLVRAARQLNDSENVFEKHKDKNFDWVLSLSAADVDQSLESDSHFGVLKDPGQNERRYFGCNLLDYIKPAGSEKQPAGHPQDRYILLATPIDLEAEQSTTTSVEFSTHQFQVIQDQTWNINMAASQVANGSPGLAGSAHRPSPTSATSAKWSTAVAASEDSDNTLTIDPNFEIKAPLSTVEDSIEELDQFEDDIEAITTAASKLALADPQKAKTRVPKEAQTAPPNQGASQKQPKATLRKVARPASLAPPKPLQKATKQPTISTFELPGERVARELKEKKAARLSMQIDPQKLAEANSPQRTRSIRSSKPPTVANFELPGERLSRQKKERFEQKLKEEEEEARRRRQFKARPPPSSVAPTVRSTFTSRQRQTPGQPEQGSSNSPKTEASPRSGASKRQSMTIAPSSARTFSTSTASTASVTARGRTSSTGSTQASTRATSPSVGSVASGRKRMSVSTEDFQQQKARGRQIYNRDNTKGRSKEQEKRDREEAIKLARQKYAQMSRNLAATSRARRSLQQSSSAQDEGTNASPKGAAPPVPKHKELYVGRNF